ncbi:MAG: hypothetical protein AUJ12_09950 [Alphaproteobacteria bacterium CG1_02_46_17]|nr:MAG: hypothetical protein AUJ12_09950 [Alphaproteobacteria bacterium CG1_02_46_17]
MTINNTNSKELVILLHGIALNKSTMWLLTRQLKKQGYTTLALTYPSTRLTIDGIADWLVNEHLTSDLWAQYDKINFVTHSMGGLVARHTLTKFRGIFPQNKIGRLVMIGPPNSGSELADFLEHFPPYRWVFGPAGKELTTHHRQAMTDDIYYEVGIIAGSAKWLYPLSCIFIRGDHDGRVSVESTKLFGMKDHIILRSSHTIMIYRAKIAKQVIQFLKHGEFQHDA